MNGLDYIIQLLARIVALVPILVLHELAHAFVAYKCGDGTAKWAGRLTLNPLKHFDVAGFILFALAGFGWAKPVPINPNNFHHYRRDLAFVSVAGVVVNFLLAFIFYPLYRLFATNVNVDNYLFYFIQYFLYYMFTMDLSFFVFNILPLPPLDGFRLVDALNHRRGKVFRFIATYGYKILIGLVVESFLCSYLTRLTGNGFFEYFDILGYYMGFVINWVSIPITAFWGLFL